MIFSRTKEANKTQQKYIDRAYLQQFMGQIFYVVCMNNGILRNKQCAFYIALSEKEAGQFFYSIINDLPRGAEFSTVRYNVSDLSALNALFNDDYPGFMLIGHGFVRVTELYTARQEATEMVRDLYKSGSLYSPLNEKGYGMMIPVGNTHVTQSFFTDRSEAEAIPGNCGVVELDIFSLLMRQRLNTVLYSIDGRLVSGWEMYEGVQSAWRHKLLNSQQLKGLIGGKDLHILMSDPETSAVMHYNGLPILFTDSESLDIFRKANRNNMTCEMFDVEIAKPKEGLPIFLGDFEYAVIDTGEKHFCYSKDLYRIATDTPGWIKSDVMERVQEIMNFETVYTLVFKDGCHKGHPIKISDNPTASSGSIAVFVDWSEAGKFIEEHSLNADIGIIRRNSRGRDMKAIVLGAYHMGIENVEICYSLSTGSLNVPTKEWLDYADIFGGRIGITTEQIQTLIDSVVLPTI
ncbi:MAG: hypothetical protein K6F84_08480 [Lachnospiraceae bacterium]|nr:hypothetical protein [Lachnospiraceae bacterium]